MENEQKNKEIRQMTYKDSKIEIDDMKIKFKNGVIILFLTIFISIATFYFIYSKGNLLYIAGAATGLTIAILVFRHFVGVYLKNTIDLSRIKYVKRLIWDKSIDSDRDFWGTGKYKYHFPTGINKKENPEVIFVHLKGKKAAIGFVPDNMENILSVLKERGIKILDTPTD